MINKDERLCRDCKYRENLQSVIIQKIPVISLQNIQDSPKGFH